MFKKSSQSSLSLVTFRFLKRQLKNFTGWVQTFFTFSFSFLLLTTYMKKRDFECAVYFFCVFNSEIVFLFYLFFSNSDIDTIHDFCFHQYYNIKLGSSLISHMFIYQTNTQWAQSLFEIIFE